MNFLFLNQVNIKKKKIRDSFELSSDTFIFLYVGRFIHLKGIDLLVNKITVLKNIFDKKEMLVILLAGKKMN